MYISITCFQFFIVQLKKSRDLQLAVAYFIQSPSDSRYWNKIRLQLWDRLQLDSAAELVSAAVAPGRPLRAGTDSSGASELGSELDAGADALTDDEAPVAAGAGGASLEKGAHEQSATNLPAPAKHTLFEYVPPNSELSSLSKFTHTSQLVCS